MSNQDSTLSPFSGRPAWSTANDPFRGMEAEEPYVPVQESAIVPENQRDGCWYGFVRGLRGLWSTRQMGRKPDDKDWYIRTTLRELLLYLVFLIILCVLTFGMMSPTMYYQTKVISELFLDSTYEDTKGSMRDSTQMADFWRFVDYVMLDALYWETWYNQQAALPEDRNILYENRLLGSPRLRQLRILNDSCKIHPDFKQAITLCYDVYNPHIEDPEPFGLMNGTAWTYHTEKELHGSSHWGLLATYSGAGSYIDLGTTKAVAKERMDTLKKNLWLSRATRAVFLDFTVYNANINLFTVVKLVFEFPATGGLVPSWSFRTVKLLRYVSTGDYFVLACEAIFVIFIIYYIVEESLEISRNKIAYFKEFWNILDVVVIVMSCICIAFSIYRTVMVDQLLSNLLEDPETFADFEFLGFWQTQFNNAVALSVFFAWIKFFKYISFNKTMTQLSSTLSRCSKDVAGFGTMFFIIFFAFAQLGYLLFGSQVEDFSSFMVAVFTLLRLILGDFDFEELEAANRILGPIYFLSYVFFVFFVLMNMFLAIINDTYAEVKAEISSQTNEFELVDYFKKSYNSLLGKLGKRNQLLDLQNALKNADADGDQKLSYEEVRQKLREQNLTEPEIEMLFARYDVDGNRELDQEETRQMLADLEGQRVQLDKEIEQEQATTGSRPTSAAPGGRISGGGVSLDDFSVLTRRVDRMEHSIGSMVSKIDAVLVKLEGIERARSKRRDNMNKILDSMAGPDAEGMDDRTRSKHMEKLIRDELKRWDSEASLNPASHLGQDDL